MGKGCQGCIAVLKIWPFEYRKSIRDSFYQTKELGLTKRIQQTEKSAFCWPKIRTTLCFLWRGLGAITLEDDSLKISAPLYLVGMKIDCWKCQKRMPVIANWHRTLKTPTIRFAFCQILLAFLTKFSVTCKNGCRLFNSVIPKQLEANILPTRVPVAAHYPGISFYIQNLELHSFQPMRKKPAIFIWRKFPFKEL